MRKVLAQLVQLAEVTLLVQSSVLLKFISLLLAFRVLR